MTITNFFSYKGVKLWILDDRRRGIYLRLTRGPYGWNLGLGATVLISTAFSVATVECLLQLFINGELRHPERFIRNERTLDAARRMLALGVQGGLFK